MDERSWTSAERRERRDGALAQHRSDRHARRELPVGAPPCVAHRSGRLLVAASRPIARVPTRRIAIMTTRHVVTRLLPIGALAALCGIAGCASSNATKSSDA